MYEQSLIKHKGRKVKILSPEQPGFVKGRGTRDNIFDIYQRIEQGGVHLIRSFTNTAFQRTLTTKKVYARDTYCHPDYLTRTENNEKSLG